MSVSEKSKYEIEILKSRVGKRDALCCDIACAIHQRMLDDGHSGCSWGIASNVFLGFAKHKDRLDLAQKRCREQFASNDKKFADACKNGEDFDWEPYIDFCWRSALSTYRMLCDARIGDETMSEEERKLTDHDFVFIRDVFKKLARCLPLTPILEDEPSWYKSPDIGRKHEYVSYDCTRHYGLRKYVYPDGTVKYRDFEAVVAMDVYDDGFIGPCSSSNATKAVEEVIGNIVKFPYTATVPPYKVYRKTYNTVDGEPGSYDMYWHQYILTPKGEKIPINRFYVEQKEGDDVEVTSEEFYKRLIEAEPGVNKKREEIAQRIEEGTRKNKDQLAAAYRKPFSFNVTPKTFPKERSTWLPPKP